MKLIKIKPGREDCLIASQLRLTLIYNFFLDQGGQQAIDRLLAYYDSFHPIVRSRLDIVLVDDCSKVGVHIPKDNYQLNIRYIRIQNDIPWNQSGARNVGAIQAASEKIILCDIDHLFPEKTIGHLIERKFGIFTYVYKFYRKSPERDDYVRPHANIFFMSRSNFIRHYGYDEEFAGGYGGEDVWFVKNLKYHGVIFKKLPKKYFCIRRNDFDRNTEDHSLVRDHERNAGLYEKKVQLLRRYGPEAGHSRKISCLSYEVKQVSVFSLNNKKKSSNRTWIYLWWFRTLKFWCS